MDTTFIIYAAVALLAYGLLSKRLASTPISGPMVFVGLGVAASSNRLSLHQAHWEKTSARSSPWSPS